MELGEYSERILGWFEADCKEVKIRVPVTDLYCGVDQGL